MKTRSSKTKSREARKEQKEKERATQSRRSWVIYGVMGRITPFWSEKWSGVGGKPLPVMLSGQSYKHVIHI